jgi:carbamoylphosphate synthase small subunit
MEIDEVNHQNNINHNNVDASVVSNENSTMTAFNFPLKQSNIGEEEKEKVAILDFGAQYGKVSMMRKNSS